jgi:hypothetical protein
MKTARTRLEDTNYQLPLYSAKAVLQVQKYGPNGVPERDKVT